MTQRSQNALTQNQLDNARFRALADGAVHLAVFNLLSQPIQFAEAEWLWLPDGAAHNIQLGGRDIEVCIFNEASRIDLNQISGDQFTTLLELADAPPEDVDTLVGAVLDWRDTDQFTSLNGAEDDDYRADGYSYGAADQNFESLDELLQVRGMTQTLFRELEPDLRVGVGGGSGGRSSGPVFGGSNPDSGRSVAFAPQFASARALAAMKNLAIEDAELLVAERNQAQIPGAKRSQTSDRGGPFYRIRVTSLSDDGFGRVIETLARVALRDTPPFDIIWRREALMVVTPNVAPEVQ
ncbi:general secretion pathway protein GspK [Rhabdochromatium marinum]|uniref:general secretion pathway protein GspK n=1 Tax=Rhabdochromatium marinum TaxID=48729 RepID=UPI001904E430|nr:type II secretion system protein GspK [Rhabdochromatium marinum]